MKKQIWLLFLVLCFGSVSISAHNTSRQYADYSVSSGFTLDSLDVRNPQVVDNLETLCRVWGYAKYHHPVFADSMINIDYELFELLPKVVHADRTSCNGILYEWVKGLGEYTPNKAMYEKELGNLQHWSTVDLSWITDTTHLGRDLSLLLQDLRYAERGESYYIHPAKMVEGIGWQPVTYDNENYYTNITQFESGYCLLALFRLWNIIEYFAPNMPKTDKPWGQVLTEYIPRMGVKTNLRTFQQNYMSLIHEMSDGHAYFVVPDYYFGNRIVPVWTSLLDGKLIVTNSGKIDALKPGDEIISVGGQLVSDRLKDVKKYVAYSNDAGYRQVARHYPLRSQHEQCVLGYLRDGQKDSITVNTVSQTDYKWYVDPDKAKQPAFRLLNDSVGYIYGATFSDTMLDDAMALLGGTKAIVVDLRTYPEQPWAMKLFIQEHLTAKPVTSILWSYPTLAIPGEYYLMPDYQLYRGLAKGTEPQDNPDAYKGKIIALVDESTQSAAEGTVMDFQAAIKTVVVGSQTAGANGNMVMVPLTGGLMTCYSSIGCYYPDGYEIQRKGVKVDIEARPTIDGIRADRDEVLETALKYVE